MELKDDKEIVIKANKELTINLEKLDDELLKQPQLYLYWATAHVIAKKRKRMSRQELKELEAELSRNFRDSFAQMNPTLRPTERMINEFLADHPVYKEKYRDLVKDEYVDELLEAIRESFRIRGQILLEFLRERREAIEPELKELFYEGERKGETGESGEPRETGRAEGTD